MTKSTFESEHLLHNSYDSYLGFQISTFLVKTRQLFYTSHSILPFRVKFLKYIGFFVFLPFQSTLQDQTEA